MLGEKLMAKAKNKKRRSKNRFLKLLVVIAIVVVGIILTTKYVNFDRLFKQNEMLNEEQQETSINDEKETIVSSAPIDENGDSKEEIKQYEGENPNQSESLTGNITYAGIVNKKVIIRVNIDQFLNSGTCTLIMRKGDMSYSEKANIIESASTSTCKGFDIPTDKFNSGDWSIEIKMQSGDKTGLIGGSIKL